MGSLFPSHEEPNRTGIEGIPDERFQEEKENPAKRRREIDGFDAGREIEGAKSRSPD